MNTRILDITKDYCPITFVKTKLELEKLKKGEKIEIFLSEGEPLENLPKTLKEQGYEIKEIKKIKDKTYKIIVQK